MPRCIIILADESAHWKIAGLRQLERLALEVASLEGVRLTVLWDPALPAERRFSPRHPRLEPRLPSCDDTISSALLLSTHLLLARGALCDFSLVSKDAADLRLPFVELLAKVRDVWKPNDSCIYLDAPTEIEAGEKRFLRASGKSQDGLVSRFINRPISRAVSRRLLRTSITPSSWTLAIFILPLGGAALLARGSYASIVIGLLLYQLYSILDGCDGEIARAKYLESDRGRQLDMWCDTAGNLLLALALGYGLGRFAEGIVVALLIAANEWLLTASRRSAFQNGTTAIRRIVYPRHERLLESGLLVFGERFGWWLIQLTKRDVALLAFLLFAIAAQAAWILHLLGGVAAISTLLALRPRLR
ncbi:MAG TPA: CDP-alcohol phosphatidyltransferase family protein [Chthoniobacterales bacterium]